ncbi:fibrocystin-L-like [Mizuhopecten yessoensis]|uniref:fibrocystin-L-like n=1 Tax=Mizuhopecten yessoensis TaxID=6573 RepID=UPI000B459E43|nr:fibrocystin-L-like [Mizuhopecten yessoensis]
MNAIHQMDGMASANDRFLLLQVATIVLLLKFSECAVVTSVGPSKGSTNGEVRLNLAGSGFAKNQFNHGAGNTNLGNTVTLVSDTKQFDCPVHIDGTQEQQIQCYTPAGMPVDTYKVKVTVDGVPVDDSDICNNCHFTPSVSNTPTITTIEPRSGPPGTIVSFYGKIFTNKYGSNIDESSNGKTVSILRVYVGGQKCELKNGDDFYGIQLDNGGDSDYGYIKCKTGETGIKIGNINGSIIISDEYGRTQPQKDLYKVSGNYQFYMFQTYAEISSVTPATGSVEGGTLISIAGNNFDETRTGAVVMVGGTPCVIKGAVTKTLITCETAAKPGSTPARHAGNRGLKLEIWNATTKTQALLSEVGALDNTAADYYMDFLDEAYYTDSTMENMVTKMSGFFVPPFDGDYSFHIKAEDGAELHFSTDDNPSNMARIAYSGKTNSYDTASSQSSSRMSLSKANKYYMEVYHREGTSTAFAKVSARFYNTNLTSAYTDNVKSEVHKLEVTSTVKREIQSLTFTGFTNGSSTSAVQEVTVEEDVPGTGGQIRLGLYTAFTGLIDFRADSSDVATAINNLPVFDSGESVSVTDVATETNGIKYTITFTSERGDFSAFVAEASDSLTVTVAKTTTGIPKGTVVALSMAGIPAPLVAPGASSSEVQSAMEKLFSTRCPSVISSPAGKKVQYTFETSSATPSYNRNYRYSEMEAFCGNYVLKNPRYIFKSDSNIDPLSLTLSPKMCFAHQGAIGANLRVWYEYTDQQSEIVGKWSTLSNVITTSGNTEWEYSCVEVLSALSAKATGGTRFYLKAVYIYRSGDVYIDEVFFGTSPPTTDVGIAKQRLKPAKPNGVKIANVTVAESSGSHHVTLFPLNCGNNFPLFTSDSAQRPIGADVAVSRVQAASAPIQGTFNLTFLGSTISSIPANIDTDDLADNLKTINGLNEVSVSKKGDCANFEWTIQYTSLAGDQSLVQVDPSQLTGESVVMTPKDVTDGHVVFDALPGEFLRVPHDKAQVMMLINDVPTKCSGTCDFEWLTGNTPTVTGISPGTGPTGTVATISGTGFSGTSANNTVMIGGTACTVNASTTTSITCTIGSGPEGVYKVDVNVAGSGLAQHSGGDVTYIYSTGIDNFSPGSSSLGGGVNLTVNGYGYRNDATVAVGGQDCPVISRSTDQLVCVIPPKTSAGAVPVVVAMTGIASSTASSSFTYDSSITAQVTSITPTTSGVKGGATITILGSGFGSSGTLIIGGTTVTPLIYSNTQVTAVLSSLTPGVHLVQVIVGTDGAAVLDSNAVPTISYILQVTNVFPLQGSLQGGTLVTITGQGLDDDAEIKIGGHPCDIDSITATTQIVCKIGDTGTKHQVDNQGSHFAFGKGFAWEPKNLQVYLGDTVHWSWDYALYIAGMKPRVQQVKNASSTEPEQNGFSSGPSGTKTGAFEFKFNTLGTNYYWSDYIDLYTTTWFRGSVQVTNKESYVGDLSVKVGGIEAVYDKNSGVSNPTGSSQCVATLSAISGCSDPAPTGGDSAKFNFKFWSCLTPTVTAISRNSGTANDEIMVTGTGLSSTTCQNEVKFGSDSCTVSAGSSSSVTCKLDSATSPPVGVQQSIDVRVGNLGSARIAIPGHITRTFAAIPVVSSFTPSLGSLEGHTPLNIVGAGFQGSTPDVDVTVTIGGYPCPISSLSYTNIVCSTPKSLTDGLKEIEVKVNAGGQMVPAECTSCNFTYDIGSTASVESVSPTSVDGSPTTLTITGKRMGGSTSDVSVTIGGEVCTVTAATTTAVECTISDVPVGAQPLVLDVAQKGRAMHDPSPVTVTSQAVITSVSPAAGSTNGGTDVTITGNGFDQGSSVTIDGASCPVTSVSLSQIVFTTAAHGAAIDRDLLVTSGSTTYTAEKFDFTVAATPVISSVSPTSGSSGDPVTLSGTNFGATIADNSVTLGERACTLTSASTTEITFIVGDYRAGSYELVVDVAGSGLSNNDKVFTFDMTASGISPNSGSTNGDQTVTISGSGFDNTTTATICSEPCVQSTAQNSTETQFICVTPAASGHPTQSCSVVVTVNSITQTLSYTYDATKTPEITDVTPTRGGTGGGTRITVSGSGFGTTKSDCSVTVEGSACVVDSVSNNQIVCDTGSISASVRGKVRVEIAGDGQALQTAADFHYVDVWSSVYTWGGVSLPTDGDLVVIQAGQTIYLDTTTAVMKMILIQGGELIFDDNQDVELKSEIILVTDGGLLQVGTEQAPFQNKATITLYGHQRSKELPIYGTKTLAVREGTLDLHGIPTPITWTMLAETANAGTHVIKLKLAVNWNVGDEIIIATTGDFKSQSQNEQKTITAIAGDQKTLTLDSNLAHEHIAVTESFGTSANAATLDFAAEVGLLTHNVKVQGNSDAQWIEKIEACPDGFNTGEFATQTCFQGRFGEEMGSDQFGGQIMIHAPEFDTHRSTGRIQYVELFHMGQAFRLGRYPLHFHLNGDMSHCYARGLGIHETFNRAVNIHGTHNLLVEHIVIYNIMGGAFFLEDGIESGNTIQYNLAIFVRESSSLLNDDVTPASFWVTNPNNTIQHNHAAGGSHFGFWYRMHDHPEGPSFTNTVCPKLVTLGVFHNNSAHSFGWFGLWIFPTYTPRVGGICGSSAPTPVVFDTFLTWNNEKGAETVNTGAIQFKNIRAISNKKAGFEGKLIVEGEDLSNPTNEAALKDSLIVGHASFSGGSECTNGAVVIPYGFGFQINNVEFVNFDRPSCSALIWTRIDGTCGDQCGGFSYKTSGLTWTSSPNRGRYAWLFEGILEDQDGTLCDSANCKVIPTTETLPPSCVNYPDFNFGIPASKCPSAVKFHRFGFNEIKPSSLEFKQSNWTNQHGSSLAEYRDKRITHKKGWVLDLVSGKTYNVAFVNSAPQTNISFSGTVYHLEGNDYILLRQEVNKKPDRLRSSDRGFVEASETALDPSTNINGDWTFDHYTNEITILVKGNGGGDRRKKRSSPSLQGAPTAQSFNFQAFKCFYTNCTPPPDPNTVPPVTQRPTDFVYWSASNSWTWLSNTLPEAGTDLTIPKDVWMVADMAIPWFNKVILYGTIEFDHGPTAPYCNIDLNATHIIILGGRLIIGWPDAPYLGNSQVILRGNWQTAEYTDLTNAPTVGAKAIGVFGGLDLHGIDVGVSWTRLAATAAAGASTITLAKAVNWTAGNEIVLATTSYDMWETETFRISSVSQDGLTLTLNSSLLYKHVVHTETINGMTINLGAEVGLLSRNVKVIGEDYANMFKESFGARTLVGVAQQGSSLYIGYARLSNVEFFHTGQESYTEFYDARFSLTFLDGGTVSNIKPSSVNKCAFHNGFSPAIGVYGTHGLPIDDNVLHHTVWWGIETFSDDTRLRRNLLTLVVWEGAYQDREEQFNYRFEGAINAEKAKDIVIEDNVVAGAERVGYRLNAMECGSAGYGRNLVHSSLTGFGIFPEDELTVSCVQISNITAWKCRDSGIFYENSASVEINSVLLIENTVGTAPLVIGPAAISHLTADKYVLIKDSTVVGATTSFDCATDTLKSDENIAFSSQARTWNTDGSHIGIGFAMFLSGSNNMPKKPHLGSMSYPAILGITNLDGVTFAHFNTICGVNDFAVTTNAKGDDGLHPIKSKNAVLNDVSTDNKIRYYRPNVGKINSADCVDMDCDGLKKGLFSDEDGSFLGSSGAVVPQSEWEWDGDARRGLGDYRIPKTMLTTLDGTRIPVNDIAPNKGIIRNNNCQYRTAWQAYQCTDLTYKMLIIESMDADTETRRVSPVAILGDGYLDLINGPQDHGWCSGYTCRKRVSTFMALVATGKEYLIHFTGTSPQHLRYFLIDANSTQSIKLAVWYSQPNRRDVYVEGISVQAKNGRTVNGAYILDPPTYPEEFMPNVSDTSGQNYFDRDSGLLHFTIRGDKSLEVKTDPSIIVSFQFPAMSIDDFFGPQLIQHLAAFFNLSPDKVRLVKIVRETTPAGRRRKRSTGNDQAVVEISDTPRSNINDSSGLTPEQLQNISATLVNEIQLGNISQVVNLTVVGVAVVEPLASPGTPEWNATTTDSAYIVISEASSMRFNPAPEPQHEGVVFRTQPKIQVLNAQGQPITQLGTASQPWEITASLRPGGSNALANLTGNLTVEFVNGWANFTDLLITQFGTDFYIDFTLTVPTDSNFTIASDPLTVTGRPIIASISSMTSTVIENNNFAISVELRDEVTSELIPDIAWRGHTWTMTAELNKPELHPGSMAGSNETVFSTSSSAANFYTLSFTSLGIYALKLHIFTTPSGFDFYKETQVVVRSQAQTSIIVEQTTQIVMIFDDDYNAVVGADVNAFAAMMATRFILTYPDILFNSVSVVPGSIVVTYTVSGGVSDVNTTVYGMCESVQNGSSFTFNSQAITLSGYLSVGGISYYGVYCGPLTTTDPTTDESKIALALIIALSVVSVALLAIVVAIIIWKCKVYPKTKTRDLHKYTNYDNQPNSIEDILFREQSFMSIRAKSAGLPQAPAATNINSFGGYSHNMEKKSPLPF